MIARLVGRLVGREGGRGIIDVRDVGYAVVAPQKDLDAWSRTDGNVVVYVQTDVREDAITLYGFADDLDRVTFEALRVVDGIGPKVALACLDALGRDKLAAAVASDDLTALCRAPGVGKKLAQRMALELKGKLALVSFVPPAVEPKVEEAAGDDPLVLALGKLGYHRSEVARAVAALAADGIEVSAPVADRLRRALRVLSGR